MANRVSSIYLDEAVWETLKKEAGKKERSVNWVIAHLIRDHLAKEKGGKAKG